jgi:hypothetical protein
MYISQSYKGIANIVKEHVTAFMDFCLKHLFFKEIIIPGKALQGIY